LSFSREVGVILTIISMKKLFIIILLSCIFVSCATLFNTPTTAIDIYTTKPSRIVVNNDTTITHDNKVSISVMRSRDPITITAISDSIKKVVKIESIYSLAYVSNVFFLYGIAGAIVDHNSPKQFTYPFKVYLNSNDTSGMYYLYGKANNRNELYLKVSIPEINTYLFRPLSNGVKTATGFLGISAGIDYYHKKNQYLNLSVTCAADYYVPFPAPIDCIGKSESLSSIYLSLSNNYKINRFSLGYGLSYCRNYWTYDYNSSMLELEVPVILSTHEMHDALGLIFSSYIQFGRYFDVGLIYRPTFIALNPQTTFQYEHLISIDFAWKIRLKK